MKVIFLDIDGVLVAKSHLFGLDAQKKPMSDSMGLHLFDPACVANFKRILDTTGAKIVLSSSWKMFGFEMFTTLWKQRNMPGEIMEFTPGKALDRGQEIEAWLNDHVGLVENFVIIDDDTFDLLSTQLPHVVRTTFDDGLTDELANDAIHILNNTAKEKN